MTRKRLILYLILGVCLFFSDAQTALTWAQSTSAKKETISSSANKASTNKVTTASRPTPEPPQTDHPLISFNQVPDEAYAAYAGKKFTSAKTPHKLIALTFDDGPHRELTPKVIQILQEKGAVATFFMLGNSVTANPQIVKQVADAGFEIGTHSISHPNLGKASEEKIRREIEDSCDMIEQASGTRPKLFRPPYGNTNESVRKVCEQNGLVIIHWSVDPRDWAPKASPEDVRKATLKQAHSGAIVCIHDIHKRTIEALPLIIDDLKAQGYTLVTVGQLLAENEVHKNDVISSSGTDAAGATASALPENVPLNRTALVN